jgi:hypothetical protein
VETKAAVTARTTAKLRFKQVLQRLKAIFRLTSLIERAARPIMPLVKNMPIFYHGNEKYVNYL